MKKAEIIRYIFGAIFVVVGFAAVFAFAPIRDRLLFLSQDNQIVPHTLLQLRLVLMGLGFTGLVLLLKNPLISVLSQFMFRVGQLSRTQFLVIFLSVGAVLRIAALFLPFHLWGDWQTYNMLAGEWMRSGSYSVNGIPYAYRPPVYPFFLMIVYEIFGQIPRLGAAFNVVFSTGIVYLSYKLIGNFWGEKRARLAAIILVFFPSQILFVNKLATEPLFTMLLLAGLHFMSFAVKHKKYTLIFLGGIFLGLAGLTRAIALAYLFFPLLYLLFQKERAFYKARNCLLLILGMMLVVLPWMYRNYDLKGSFTIATNAGINLLIGNAPGSGMGWNQAITEQFDINDPSQQVYVDSAATAIALENIRKDPSDFLKRGVLKLGYFYAVDMEGVWNEMVAAANAGRIDKYVLLGLAAESYYLVILMLCLCGLVYYFRTPDIHSAGGFLLGGTILYWSAVHFVFFGDGRFHFPIIPMIVSFAALYLEFILGGPKKSPGR